MDSKEISLNNIKEVFLGKTLPLRYKKVPRFSKYSLAIGSGLVWASVAIEEKRRFTGLKQRNR